MLFNSKGITTSTSDTHFNTEDKVLESVVIRKPFSFFLSRLSKDSSDAVGMDR